MKKKIARVLAFAMIMVMALPLASGCGKTEQAKKVVFHVEDTDITLDEVWFYCQSVQEYYESYYSSMFSSPDVWTSSYPVTKDDGTTEDSTLEDVAKRSAIKQIRQIKIAAAHAKELKVSLGADEKKAVIKQAKTFMQKVTSDEKKKMGVTQELAEKVFEESAVVEKMKSKLAEKEGIEISDEEAQTSKIYYIYFPTIAAGSDGSTAAADADKEQQAKSDADDALERIKAGNDIATVAAAYGMTGTSGEQTVDAASDLPEEIGESIANLKDGETFDKVIHTSDGYYIIQMINRVDEEATADRKKQLMSQKEQELLEKKFDEWTKDDSFDYDKDVNWDYMKEINFVKNSSVKETKNAATATTAANAANDTQDVNVDESTQAEDQATEETSDTEAETTE